MQPVDLMALFPTKKIGPRRAIIAELHSIHLFRGLLNMNAPANYRRPAFTARPWVRGSLYDALARSTVLHCDAYVMHLDAREYLCVMWREGGRRLIAADAWLITPDALLSIWDAERIHNLGVAVLWTPHTHATLRRVHQSVLGMARDTEGRFARWPRVSVYCHYVHVRELDPEIAPERNHYKPRATYRPRAPVDPASPLGLELNGVPTMAELQASPSTLAKRPRGRPRKVRPALPDWL